jgi:hypothetical protein
MICKKIGCEKTAQFEIRITLPVSLDGQHPVYYAMFDCEEHTAEMTREGILESAKPGLERMASDGFPIQPKDIRIEYIPLAADAPDPCQEG